MKNATAIFPVVIGLMSFGCTFSFFYLLTTTTKKRKEKRENTCFSYRRVLTWKKHATLQPATEYQIYGVKD